MKPIAFLICMCLSSIAFAVPTELAHQGRLMDSTGVPYSGTHYLTFRLYEDTTTTTPLWEEVVTTSFDNGYYAIQLGTDPTNPLDDAIFDVGALYVGLAVNSGPELPDRIQMSSTPFARRAAVAERTEGGVVDATEVYINGLQVIDSTGTFVGTLSELTLSGLGCSSGEIPLHNGTSWTCSAGSITSLTCTAGQLASFDGSDWACVDDTGILGGLNCAADDMVVFDGTTWGCHQNDSLTSIGNLSCTDGQSISWDDSASEWACHDNTLSQATVLSYVTDSAIDLANGSTVGGQSITDTLNDLGCAEGEIAQLISGTWQCASIGVTTGDTLDGLSCSDYSIAEYSAGSWQCAPSDGSNTDTLADLSCVSGEIAEYDGSAWGCISSSSVDTLGSLSCSADETIIYGGASTGWECETLALVDSDTLADLMCDDGEIASWNDSSSVWECTVLALADADTLADLALSCAAGDIPQWDGSDWYCASESLANLTCSTDEIPLWDGTAWGCVAAATATVSWDDITSLPTVLDDIVLNGLKEEALPFTGLNEVSGGALDNEFTYDYDQSTPTVINDGQENNPTSSMATVPAIGPSLSIQVTVDTLGNSNHGAVQYLLRHDDGTQIVDYTIVAYGDYSGGSSTAAETWTVSEALDNMVSTQSNLVYPEGTWTLLAYDNADLPSNPTPGEDGSFTWDMQIIAVTPDMASVNGDLVVDGDVIVTGTITQSTAPSYTDATLENSWVNYSSAGGAYAQAGYTKDASGFVHLRGLIKDGVTCPSSGHGDCVLFTLPAGYRPAHRGIFAQFNASGAAVRVDVDTDGDVQLVTSVSNGWLSLEGIVFDAFQ